MARPLTKRQKAYRKYLLSDHWIGLRTQAFERDGFKCVECQSADGIQAHHTCYRGRFEDTLLEDLQTLCRDHHRAVHGFGTSKSKPYDEMLRLMESKLQTGGVMPTPEEEKKLAMLSLQFDIPYETEAFFRSVATMRIIMNNRERWSSWLQKGREVKSRLWPWSKRKYERLNGVPGSSYID